MSDQVDNNTSFALLLQSFNTLRADFVEHRREMKTDMTNFETNMKSEMNSVRSEVKNDIATVRNDLDPINKAFTKAQGGYLILIGLGGLLTYITGGWDWLKAHFH
jgi:hypothetical protein